MAMTEHQQIKKFSAIKISINNLKNTTNIIKEKEFISLSFNSETLVRVNLIGIVVSVDETGFLLDDGTNNIFCRFFDFFTNRKLTVGELILVVGKPRFFENQIYVSCEIIRPLEDFSWFKLRKLELEKEENNRANDSEKTISRVYSILKELDKGQGVDISNLNSHLGYNAKFFIENLIKNGEVFKIKGEKFKVLE